MNRKRMPLILTVASSVFMFSLVLAAQDRYSLKSPDGIGFSEFRGYEVWQQVAPSHENDVVKSILGNPLMIKTYQDGFPANGKSVPDGAMMAKIQWVMKNNPLLPGAAKVPDRLKQVGFMVKDSKRFPDTNGWGYAEFIYDATSRTFKPLGDAAPFAKTACHQCHTTGAKARDFVFTSYAER